MSDVHVYFLLLVLFDLSLDLGAFAVVENCLVRVAMALSSISKCWWFKISYEFILWAWVVVKLDRFFDD